MEIGICDYGTYLPRHRLTGEAVAHVLGTRPSTLERSVAGFDEDTTTMGFEAARAMGADDTDGLVFATTRPAYRDKTNATAIHAALRASRGAFAYDMCGSGRGGAGALRLCLSAVGRGQRLVAIASELQVVAPGSPDETAVGDGACAIRCGDGDVIASLLGLGATSDEYLDAWRLPTDRHLQTWDPRFSEGPALAAGRAAVGQALAAASVEVSSLSAVVVTGRPRRAVARLAGEIGGPVVSPFAEVGSLGAADLGFGLSAALDRGSPGDVVLAVNLADGADAFVFRLTDALHDRRAARGATGDDVTLPVPYSTYLGWRGLLDRSGPRRPTPAPPAGPPSYRNRDWKFHLSGSSCTRCDTVHLPPSRTCVRCRSVDAMADHPVAHRAGTLAFSTDDHLSFSPSPPRIVGMVDIDGGGRLQCDIADVGRSAPEPGQRMELVLRKYFTAESIHDYFWKARTHSARENTP